MLTIASLDIGQMIASFEMTLNGKWPLLFSGHHIFLINGCLMVVIFIFIYFGIFDVITRKDENVVEKVLANEPAVPKKKLRFIIR